MMYMYISFPVKFTLLIKSSFYSTTYLLLRLSTIVKLYNFKHFKQFKYIYSVTISLSILETDLPIALRRPSYTTPKEAKHSQAMGSVAIILVCLEVLFVIMLDLSMWKQYLLVGANREKHRRTRKHRLRPTNDTTGFDNGWLLLANDNGHYCETAC